MSNIPDFTDYGYQTQQILGSNTLGGRLTYKAIDLARHCPVVIKHFQFITNQSSWSDYQAIEKEIEVLKQIEHTSIPRYLGNFDSGNGLCLVQEYKEAQPLSVIDNLSLAGCQKIAIAILEILVYLQQQNPIIIHRDIKPENILVTPDLKVYLVDFGFARLESQDFGVSSTVKGTMGFMSPEQMLNLPLSKAADLYSLGVTLISVLTKTKSSEIGKLIDHQLNIKFAHLLPPGTKPEFRNWLEKMVETDVKKRFDNAKQALQSLQSLSVFNANFLKIKEYTINLAASKISEKLTYNLSINSKLLHGIKQGEWLVASHTSDPPHTPNQHPWITFNPQKFKNNTKENINCDIIINTSLLKANKIYCRDILLQSQSDIQTYLIPLRVKTAPIPLIQKRFPSFIWILWFVTALVVSFLTIIFSDFLVSSFNYLVLLIAQIRELSHYLIINDGIIILSIIVANLVGINYWLKQRKFLDFKLYSLSVVFFMPMIKSLIYGLSIGIIIIIFIWLHHLFRQETMLLDELLWKKIILSSSLAADVFCLNMYLGYLLGELLIFKSRLEAAGLHQILAGLFIFLNLGLGYFVARIIMGYDLSIIMLVIYLSQLTGLTMIFGYLIVKDKLRIKKYRQLEKRQQLINS